MKQLDDLGDDRLKRFCVHCGGGVDEDDSSREHFPTRSLLDKSDTELFPTLPVHKECNRQFALDEEYLAAFLASVLSGSTEVDEKRFQAVAKTLRHSPKLRRRIDRAQKVQGTLWGGPEILWMPEIERVKRVIVKNARGHVYYELGEPLFADPYWVGVCPLSRLSPDQREWFEGEDDGSPLTGWPEVGSRLMQRVAIGDLRPGGWIEVQPHVYRYSVTHDSDAIKVKMVLRDYLAAEVLWDEADIS